MIKFFFFVFLCCCCCYCCLILTLSLLHIWICHTLFSEYQPIRSLDEIYSNKFTKWLTNSVYLDQMASVEDILSGSTLFAKTGPIWVQMEPLINMRSVAQSSNTELVLAHSDQYLTSQNILKIYSYHMVS